MSKSLTTPIQTKWLFHYGLIGIVLASAGCNTMPPSDGNTNDNTAGNENNSGGVTGGAEVVVWEDAFDGDFVGGLTSVWGTGPNDIFAVGGQGSQAEVYHFDGTIWQAMAVPEVRLLSCVYGFAPDDVYAVGEGGGILHYDGSAWTQIESGTDEILWGIWGSDATTMWIVGGNPGDDVPPFLFAFDGTTLTPETVPANDRAATALFGIWGSGDKVVAVGSSGLIIEREALTGRWEQVDAGMTANQDFVAVSGVGQFNFVAVGGREPSGGRIAIFDGTGWETHEPLGVGPLSAVCMVSVTEAVIGGEGGFLGSLNLRTGELTEELLGTDETIRGLWSNDTGQVFSVALRSGLPLKGRGLLRTIESTSSLPDTRPGTQPDNNQDGDPDAPLNVDGVAPEEVIANTPPPPPPTSDIVMGLQGTDGTFSEIAEGGDASVYRELQGNTLFFGPTFRVTALPADAGGAFASVTHSLTLDDDGTELSAGSGFAVVVAVTGLEGVFDLTRAFSFEPNITEDDFDGRSATLSVTISYTGTGDAPVDPPQEISITQSVRLVFAGDA